MATCASVIEGMQILMKYQEPDDIFGVSAEHDVLYCGPSLSELEGKLTDEEKQKLDDLGWHEDSEGDCWACFT